MIISLAAGDGAALLLGGTCGGEGGVEGQL